MIYRKSIYKLNKNNFLKNISFKDKCKLVKAVKNDWNRQTIILNNETLFDYLNFLIIIDTKYKKYQEIIFMLCNQSVHSYYYKLICKVLIKYNFHMSTTEFKYKTLTTCINISPVVKQGIITNYYDIYKIEDDKKIYKVIKVTLIINLCNINDDVILEIGYINHNE